MAFGTSGHRGAALVGSFNEAHILAITQAICEYRRRQDIDGPLFLGIDTHALSKSAFASALEVLAAHGTVWTTDTDGIVLGLLSAEMTAVTGRDPGELYRELTVEFGECAYERIDAPATPEQKALLAGLSPEQITASELAGERITARLTTAPGNDTPIGGLKVVAPSGCSRRGLRAPKMSTSSTRRASRGATIFIASRRRRWPIAPARLRNILPHRW